MTEIQGKSILVRVSASFELARVRVIGSRLYSESYNYIFNKGIIMAIADITVLHTVQYKYTVFSRV